MRFLIAACFPDRFPFCSGSSPWNHFAFLSRHLCLSLSLSGPTSAWPRTLWACLLEEPSFWLPWLPSPLDARHSLAGLYQLPFKGLPPHCLSVGLDTGSVLTLLLFLPTPRLFFLYSSPSILKKKFCKMLIWPLYRSCLEPFNLESALWRTGLKSCL